jgi:hypothetical protein
LGDTEREARTQPVRTLSVRVERLTERRQRQVSLEGFTTDEAAGSRPPPQ